MAKDQDLKTIKNKNLEISKYDFIICPNCGETEVGKYCPSCGQSNKDFNKPIKEIMADLLDSINLDIRLLNTLIPFFLKPGFLTLEYFNGRRKKYVPPMRMYMFFSILFFFLIQYTSSDDLKKNISKLDEGIKTEQPMLAIGIDDDFLKHNVEVADSFNTTDSTKRDSNLTFQNLSDFDKEKIKEEVLNDSTNSNFIKSIVVGALNANENRDVFFTKFMQNFSYMLFVLMPFFALILAMILWKSRMLYVKHLIFSINFHSFIFGLSSIVMILNLILPEKLSGNEMLLLLGIPIYLMVGIKRFYYRNYVGAFFKTMGALAIYSFVLSVVVIVILAFTAKGFYSL